MEMLGVPRRNEFVMETDHSSKRKKKKEYGPTNDTRNMLRILGIFELGGHEKPFTVTRPQTVFGN